jgi:hypothetical protein
VSEQTIEAYRDWKTRRTLELDMPHAITTARRLWNWCVRHNPIGCNGCWRAPRDPRCYALGIDEIHLRLRAEIEACCADMARVAPLDPRRSAQRVNGPQQILGCSAAPLPRFQTAPVRPVH